MNWKKKVLAIGLSGVLLLGGCAGQAEETDVRQEKLTPVHTQAAAKGSISNDMIYGGQVKAAEQIYVMSKTAGRVKEVFFDIGDTVQKNDILFTLDEKDIQNSIKSLESQLAVAQVGVETAETGLRTAQGAQMESQINQADANVKRTELSLQDAKRSYEDTKRTYEDMKKLYEAGTISKQQFDQAESGYKQAESGYKQAELGYQSAIEAYDLLVNKISKENLESALDRINQAVASRNTTAVQLENAKESLKDAAVRSPIAGVVSARTIDAGEMVGGTSVPFTIVQMNTVIVNVNISEKIINKVEKGQKLEVYVQAADDKPFQGIITAVSPAADERTLTFPIKIEISNENNTLKPGMFAEVYFSLEKEEDVIVIPRNAVLFEGNQPYVYIEENGVAKRVDISVGLDSGNEIAVTGGLTEGQRVIVKGQTYLTDGGKIQVIAELTGKE